MAEVIKRKEFNEDGKEIRTSQASPPPSSVKCQNIMHHTEDGKEEVVQKKFVYCYCSVLPFLLFPLLIVSC